MESRPTKAGSGDGEVRRHDELIDGLLDVSLVHRPRDPIVLHPPLVGPHLALGRDSRGSQHLAPRREILRVGDAAAVHELHKDLASFGMDCVCDLHAPSHAGMGISIGGIIPFTGSPL